MRTKLPFTAAAAVAALAVTACSGETDGESPTSPDASPRAGGSAFDPDREGPAPPIDGAEPGGTVSVLVVNNGSDRGLYRGNEFHPEWFGDAVADAVRV